MFEFERDFAKGAVIKLEQNYRSHGNILDAANALIRHNRKRLGKELWTAEGRGEALRLYEAGDRPRGGRLHRRRDSTACAAKACALSDIALLYRSNAQSRVLEHALFNAGLPYRVYGGLRFFERQEIKHALAYLRLVANPDDDGALLRVINLPARGIGARSLEQMQEAARMRGVSLWQAACSTPLAGKAGSGRGRVRAAHRAHARRLPRACRCPRWSSGDRGQRAQGLLQDRRRTAPTASRTSNELVTAAAGFEAEGGFAPPIRRTTTPLRRRAGRSAAARARRLPRPRLAGGRRAPGRRRRRCLQLMTVHAAKGLEFHTVFISGLEEGLFPHENSLNEQDGLEEERRLMYVALTRARRRLYLSFAQSRMLHGQTRYNIASRFLQEIPEELDPARQYQAAAFGAIVFAR